MVGSGGYSPDVIDDRELRTARYGKKKSTVDMIDSYVL